MKKRQKQGFGWRQPVVPFGVSHCYLSEGRRHLFEALLPKDVKDRSSTHARALMYSAHLAYMQADYPAGQPLD